MRLPNKVALRQEMSKELLTRVEDRRKTGTAVRFVYAIMHLVLYPDILIHFTDQTWQPWFNYISVDSITIIGSQVDNLTRLPRPSLL